MAKPYSDDLRERLVRSVGSGRSRHETAKIFGVSPSCVIKLMKRYEATGQHRPKKFGGHKKPLLVDHEAQVRSLVLARPDMTVTEHWRELTKLGIEVSRSAVGRFLQRLLLTYKKNSARSRAAET